MESGVSMCGINGCGLQAAAANTCCGGGTKLQMSFPALQRKTERNNQVPTWHGLCKPRGKGSPRLISPGKEMSKQKNPRPAAFCTLSFNVQGTSDSSKGRQNKERGDNVKSIKINNKEERHPPHITIIIMLSLMPISSRWLKSLRPF